MSVTTSQILEGNPGLALVAQKNAVRDSMFRERCLAKMAAIVKAARKGEPCDVTDCDVADISRFLRDLASRHNASELMGSISNHPGMVHG